MACRRPATPARSGRHRTGRLPVRIGPFPALHRRLREVRPRAVRAIAATEGVICWKVPVRAAQGPVRDADLPPQHRRRRPHLPRHAQDATRGAIGPRGVSRVEGRSDRQSRAQGAWRPSINLGTLLAMVRLLLAEPNPDDGLMPDIVRISIMGTAVSAGEARGCRGDSLVRPPFSRAPAPTADAPVSREPVRV